MNMEAGFRGITANGHPRPSGNTVPVVTIPVVILQTSYHGVTAGVPTVPTAVHSLVLRLFGTMSNSRTK